MLEMIGGADHIKLRLPLEGCMNPWGSDEDDAVGNGGSGGNDDILVMLVPYIVQVGGIYDLIIKGWVLIGVTSVNS